MEFKGQIFNTLTEWETASVKAQETLKDLQGYTSKSYSSSPIISINDKFILVELKGFESELKEAGFDFINLDKEIIKIVDL